jgi:transcriptional regulator with XRE-family HTH domain
MKIQDILARNLVRLRREKKWTQEELADKVSLDQAYISKLETGKKEAGLEMLQRLASALGVTPAELLTPPAKGFREPTSVKKK